MDTEFIRLNYTENNSFDLRTINSEIELLNIIKILFEDNKTPSRIYLNNETGQKYKDIILDNYKLKSNIFFFY